jgi:Ca-activated chloride channel homolog
MSKINIYFFIVTLITVLFTPTQLFAESGHNKNRNTGRTMLILDASGSMQDKIDGKPKITIAVEVISDIINNWNPATQTGLLAYGHNNKNNCNDIEVLISPESINKNQFIQQINAIKPMGTTPLSASVIRAAEALNFTHDKATVVLITDGIESCNLNPCKVGRLLKNQGYDFTAHIIAFNVAKLETAGLRCLAHETGGVFIAANNASELKNAINETRELITNDEVLKFDQASIKAPSEVIAGAGFKVNWTGPKNKQDKLIILSDKNKSTYNYAYIGLHDKASPENLIAPEKPGTYQILYQLSNNRILAKTSFVVIAAKASVIGPEEVIAGSTFEVNWKGPDNLFDNIAIFSNPSIKPISIAYLNKEKPTVTLTSPEKPGVYEIRYTSFKKNTLATFKFKVIK